jgi:hypothetical protein
MRFLLGIPYVNRPDLLRLALNSVRTLWPWTIIIDNSDTPELRIFQGSWPVPIFRVPGLPLTLSQTMNLLQAKALEQNCKAWFFMHSDAELAPQTAEILLGEARQAFDEKESWGVIFTKYDTFCCFNVSAMSAVGPWDTNLPQYFADNDYYRRVELAGYKIFEVGMGVTHHEGGSCTLRSDPMRTRLNGVTFPLYQKYYEATWGGPPGAEQFLQPFNTPSPLAADGLALSRG